MGRIAMMGFLTSVIEEFLTGRGTLQQIGFRTPDQSLLGAILLIFGGATLVGTVSTLTKATGGKLSLKCERLPVFRRRRLTRVDDCATIHAVSEPSSVPATAQM